jgi:hypothetical protein
MQEREARVVAYEDGGEEGAIHFESHDDDEYSDRFKRFMPLREI